MSTIGSFVIACSASIVGASCAVTTADCVAFSVTTLAVVTIVTRVTTVDRARTSVAGITLVTIVTSAIVVDMINIVNAMPSSIDMTPATTITDERVPCCILSLSLLKSILLFSPLPLPPHSGHG